jgi:hypothetical protein
VPSKGYARLARKLAAKHLDTSRWAYAKHGVPIGNGNNFGLVKAKTRGSVSGAGLDPAHVGIPNEFNVALPGTRILKALAPAAKTKAQSAAQSPPPPTPMPPGCVTGPGTTQPTGGSANLLGWLDSLDLAINTSVNADTANVTLADINSAMQDQLTLGLINVDTSGSRVELDCTGHSYCSPTPQEPSTGEAELAAGNSTV